MSFDFVQSTAPNPTRAVPDALGIPVAALVYLVLGRLSLAYFSANNVVSAFWPATGWALATTLLGGRRYAWAAFLGCFLTDFSSGRDVFAALGTGLAEGSGALLGHWLLTRKHGFDTWLGNISAFRDLIFLGAIPCAGLSALLGVTALALRGNIPTTDILSILSNMSYWFGSDVLGVIIVTPLVLIWRTGNSDRKGLVGWVEIIVVIALALALGQMVYLNWLPDFIPQFSRKAFWIVVPCLWAALRLGPSITSLLLFLITIQVNISIHANIGFLAHPDPYVRTIDAWLSVVLFGVTLMALAAYIQQLKKTENDLQIAATAFECQEGMIITDADMRILRTNQSFSRIMGYTNEEVVGKTTSFMRSDRHPASFYENAWETGRREGTWHSEVWHRRKNGEVFQQWLTCTAVKDEQGVITNFVVTHMDITAQKQQEAQRLADETAHRDALVREVHHRIKNNLQGITGMLRQFSQAHPELADIINQATSQVRSIAVLHGLQGHTSMDTVRLCELTRAISGDVQSVWQTPIAVDIPALWTPCIIAEKEAVPIALVLNELIVNAVKHGGKAHDHVGVSLCKGQHEEAIQVTIRNTGHLRSNLDRPTAHHAGLQLIDSLMPRHGASLSREQHGNEVLTRLELEPPVIHLEGMPP